MMGCGDTCGAIVVKMAVLMLMQAEAKGSEQYNQGKKRCNPFLHGGDTITTYSDCQAADGIRSFLQKSQGAFL